MTSEQLRMMQQMQGAQQPQMPQGVPWYDRFGWWTVVGLLISGILAMLAVLPPIK